MAPVEFSNSGDQFTSFSEVKTRNILSLRTAVHVVTKGTRRVCETSLKMVCLVQM